MSSRVFVAYTGGTIGMQKSDDGHVPSAGALERAFTWLSEREDPDMPSCTLHEFDPLLDSANMGPEDWNAIGRVIRDNYDSHDGFVVIHGTDTMAYTASALSFMLKGLRKPVIITGSQIPLTYLRNDARRNLIDALLVAGNYAIPEVCVLFNGLLLRGNRTVKISADALSAFDTPNLPPLAHLDTRIDVFDRRVRRAPHGSFELREMGEVHVAALRLFPGLREDILENILQPPLQGLVLECYGVGNAPVRDGMLERVIKEATDRGVLVAICTQCAEGIVDLRGYATGSALLRAGAIGALDMTAEAVMTKMMYLLSKGHEGDDLKRRMQQDLRGELTPLPDEA